MNIREDTGIKESAEMDPIKYEKEVELPQNANRLH